MEIKNQTEAITQGFFVSTSMSPSNCSYDCLKTVNCKYAQWKQFPANECYHFQLGNEIHTSSKVNHTLFFKHCCKFYLLINK